VLGDIGIRPREGLESLSSWQSVVLRDAASVEPVLS
jgi:hypothetical protein